MNKIYSLIIFLITCSLLGIVVIQVSWIKNALIIKQEQFEQRIEMAVGEVGQEIAEHKSRIPGLTSPKLSSEWPGDQFQLLMRRPTVAERYTSAEIKEKIRKAFNRHGLGETPFEFAITNNIAIYSYEMQSANFGKLSEDTIHNRIFFYPLISPGTIAEGLAAEENMFIIVPNVKNFVMRELGLMIGGAVLFTLVIFTAFFLTVRTMLKQKKLSEIKSDFINNMTHEFKTPLATISLAVDALKNEKVIQSKEKLNYFSGIIKEENKRMNKQVETILQAALLDKQEVQLNLKSLHVHDVISRVLDNFKLQLDEKQAVLDLDLQARNDIVLADELHFTNLISNLVDNAIKYSKENTPLHLHISSQNSGKKMRMTIEDNGIGMSRETLNRIFEKFYRAHTGNLHNVKGFGLGLSYVKTMVEAHKGTINVDSLPGRGSSFVLEFDER